MMEQLEGAQNAIQLKATETSLVNASLKSKIDTLSKMMGELISTNMSLDGFQISERTLKWYGLQSGDTVRPSQEKALPKQAKAAAKVKPKAKRRAKKSK